MPEYERSEVASSDKKQKVTSEGFYNGDGRNEIWTVGFAFHHWMSGVKRSSMRLMMIVRVPKRQKPSQMAEMTLTRA